MSLGATAMFVLLGIAHYADSTDVLKAGGWVGFVTPGPPWYSALADMVNVEFERPLLPTGPDWLTYWHLRTR